MSEIIKYIDDLTNKIQKEQLNGNRAEVIEEYQNRRNQIADLKNYQDKLRFTFTTVSYVDKTIKSERPNRQDEINQLKSYLSGLVSLSQDKKEKFIEVLKDNKLDVEQKIVPMSIKDAQRIKLEINLVINRINQLENE